MTMWKSLQVRTSNLIGGSLKDNIVFLHIPKCAGNSIGAAIHDRYKTFSMKSGSTLVNINATASLKAASWVYGHHDPFEDDYRRVLTFREHLLLYFLSLEQTRYVDGHFSFSDLAYKKFSDRYAFITVLRDPVKRWISAFFYNRYRKDGNWKIQSDLLEYLDTPRSRANGWEYVKKLQGSLDPAIDCSSSEAIEKAKSNLRKFAVVGLLEDLEGFRTGFKDRFGVDLKIEQKNQGPKSGDFVRSAITDDIEERIRQICSPDLAVYEHALENSRMRGSIGSDLAREG